MIRQWTSFCTAYSVFSLCKVNVVANCWRHSPIWPPRCDIIFFLHRRYHYTVVLTLSRTYFTSRNFPVSIITEFLPLKKNYHGPLFTSELVVVQYSLPGHHIVLFIPANIFLDLKPLACNQSVAVFNISGLTAYRSIPKRIYNTLPKKHLTINLIKITHYNKLLSWLLEFWKLKTSNEWGG